MQTPLLTVVTVVYNDWPALERTLASVRPHVSEDIEHWVIDGSSTAAVREGLADGSWAWVRLLSEPDAGLYDAMNKGLARASGRYVLFINAGDELHPGFSLATLREAMTDADPVLFGYSVEFWGQDQCLRPGLDREGDVLSMPPHPATFYPRRFYTSHRYDLARPISADGAFTAAAVAACGAAFVPVIVSRFELGGRSSTYGDLGVLRARYREAPGLRSAVKLLAKAALWRVTSPAGFYRILARGKYTPIADERELSLLDGPLTVVAPARTASQ